MPRIPVYAGGQVDLPATIPYGRLPAPGPSGIMAAAQGVGQVSESLTQAAVLEKQAALAQARVDEALKKEEVALDITRLTSRFEIDYANYETEISETGIPPERVAEHMRLFAQQHMKTLGDELRYPDSKTKFLTAIEPVVRKSIIGTDSIAVKRRHAMLEGDARLQNDRDALAAVIGPPEQRQARLQSILDRVNHLTNVGIYGGKERATELERTTKEIQKGEVVRDIDNPEIAASVMDRLYIGGYPMIGGLAEQRAFANQLLDRRRIEVERADKERKEAWERDQKTAYGEMLDKAWDGTLSREEYNTKGDFWRLEPSQRNHLRELMAKEPSAKEPASDGAIRDLAFRGTATINPSVSQKQLDYWRAEYLAGRPGLNFQDWKENTGRLHGETTRQIAEGHYGHSLVGQQQAQAEQLIQTSLGLPPGPVPPGVDATTLRVLGAAIAELTNRSAYFPGGKEPPLTVAREIVARPGYVNAIGSNLVKSASELQGGLPIGQTPEKLDAQFRGNRNHPEYRRQFDIYMKLLELQRQEQVARDEAARAAEKAITPPTVWERIFGKRGASAPPAAPLTPAPAPAAPTPPAGRRKRRTGEATP